jgi:hypothetical protein
MPRKMRGQTIGDVQQKLADVRARIEQYEDRIEGMVKAHAPAREIEDLRGFVRGQYKTRDRLQEELAFLQRGARAV